MGGQSKFNLLKIPIHDYVNLSSGQNQQEMYTIYIIFLKNALTSLPYKWEQTMHHYDKWNLWVGGIVYGLIMKRKQKEERKNNGEQ